MALAPNLPKEKDSEGAARLLVEMETKDPTLCQYPLCPNPRRPRQGKAEPKYCKLEEHNPVEYLRAKRYLERVAGKRTETSLIHPEQPLPQATASLETARSSILLELARLQDVLLRVLPDYILALDTIADPAAALEQIKAATHQAEGKISEIQGSLSKERGLRLKAEQAVQALQEKSELADEAAEQATTKMDQAITRQGELELELENLKKTTEQRISEIENARDEAISLAQTKAKEQIAEIQRQTTAAVEKAHNEAKAATTRAETAEQEATRKIALAEQGYKDARESLNLAHEENARLREQSGTLRGEHSQQIETMRREHNQQIETMRTDHKEALGREREERTQLRGDLLASQKQVEYLTGLIKNLSERLPGNPT